MQDAKTIGPGFLPL